MSSNVIKEFRVSDCIAQDVRERLQSIERKVDETKWRLCFKNKQHALTINDKVIRTDQYVCDLNCDDINVKVTAPCRCVLTQVFAHDNDLLDFSSLIFTYEERICQHPVQFEGLCGDCGEPVGVTTHVRVGFISQAGLHFNESLAIELFHSKINECLSNKKLILVLDLDQTLIHAFGGIVPPELVSAESRTSVEVETTAPAAAQSKNDDETSSTSSQATNTNYFPQVSVFKMDSPSLKLKAPEHSVFSTPNNPHLTQWPMYVNNTEAVRICEMMESNLIMEKIAINETIRITSRIKLRPGVFRFLQNVSSLFEVYLYTAGTSAHAQAACRVLDPENKYFGNRVFDRSSLRLNGGKSLTEIFFHENSDIIIVVDDTREVWDDSVALLKVFPYMWFPSLDMHFIHSLLHGAPDIPCLSLSRFRASSHAVCQYAPSWMWVQYLLHKRELQEILTATANRDEEVPQESRSKIRRIEEQPPAAPDASDPSLCNPWDPPKELQQCGRENVERNLMYVWDTVFGRSKTATPEDETDSRSSTSSPSSRDAATGAGSPLEKRVAYAKKVLRSCRPRDLNDRDRQLHLLSDTLRHVHKLFFTALRLSEADRLPKMPNCKIIIKEMMRGILAGVVIYAHCSSPTEFANCDCAIAAEQCGATILTAYDSEKVTHILVDSKSIFVRTLTRVFPPIPKSIYVLDFMWLEAAVSVLCRPPERFFDVSLCQNSRSFWNLEPPISLIAKSLSSRPISKESYPGVLERVIDLLSTKDGKSCTSAVPDDELLEELLMSNDQPLV